MQTHHVPIVLASASAARQQLFRDIGLTAALRPTAVDEGAIKDAMKAQGAAADAIALALAARKAETAEAAYRDGNAAGSGAPLVIGADQILVCDGRMFDKPRDLADAADQLRQLRGQWQVLHTALVCRRDGQTIWQHIAHPCLKMRLFSDECLAWYLETEGEAILSCVGACKVEGVGQHLFAEIVGDHAAIMGLPLLPLLGFLREVGAVAG